MSVFWIIWILAGLGGFIVGWFMGLYVSRRMTFQLRRYIDRLDDELNDMERRW